MYIKAVDQGFRNGANKTCERVDEYSDYFFLHNTGI